MKNLPRLAILLALGIFLAAAWPAAAAPLYTCLDLKTVAGPDVSGVYPRGIDAAGEVVGYAYPRSSSLAFLNLGSARPAPPPTAGVLIPYAFMIVPTPIYFWIPMEVIVYPVPPNKGFTAEEIARNGMYVGGKLDRQGTSGDPQPQAWVGNRASGEATWDLGTLGGKGSWCNAVNDAGQAVGGAYDASGIAQPFLYRGGVMEPLPTLPFSSGGEARDINNAGQVVGNSGHAFLYDGTIHDLGTLPPGGPGISSCAYAINEAGQVVGDSLVTIDPMPIYHAFLWDGGPEMQDLGTLPGGNNSRAYDINNAGQVVGYSTTASDVHAFLYTAGVMLDLNDLVVNLPAGVVLGFAYGINDRGQIIAGATNNDHGYLLTPVTPLPGVNLLLLD